MKSIVSPIRKIPTRVIIMNVTENERKACRLRYHQLRDAETPIVTILLQARTYVKNAAMAHTISKLKPSERANVCTLSDTVSSTAAGIDHDV